jgi:hypothetical protein
MSIAEEYNSEHDRQEWEAAVDRDGRPVLVLSEATRRAIDEYHMKLLAEQHQHSISTAVREGVSGTL